MGAGISGIQQRAKDQAQYELEVSPEYQRQHRIKAQQEGQAKEFRQNLPQYQNQIASDLRAQEAGRLSQDQQMTNTNLSQRGLLYGGIGASKRAQNRGASQQRLGAAVQASDKSLEQAASDMENNSISTGMAIQNAQQQAQNQAYTMAQAQQNSINQVIGGIAGMGLMVATGGMGLLGGGAAAGGGGAAARLAL